MFGVLRWWNESTHTIVNKYCAVPGQIYINWFKKFDAFLSISYRTVCSWVFVAFFHFCRLIFRLTSEQCSCLQFLYGEVLAPLHLAVRYVYSFHWLLFAIQTMAVKNFMDWLKSIFLPSVVPSTFNVDIDWIITWKYNQKQYFQHS